MIGYGYGYGVNLGALLNPILQIMSDGSGFAWFDYKINITKDGDNKVSAWKDIVKETISLSQADESKQPLITSDGILFDGINDYLKTQSATLEQPVSIYIVFKQVSFTHGRTIFDGNTPASGILYQQTPSPGLNASAGTAMSNNLTTIDTFCIAEIVFNGTEGRFGINGRYGEKYASGNSDMNGFTLGSNAGGTNPSNILVTEIIIRNKVDTAKDYQTIYNYLATKYSIGTPFTIFDNGKFVLAFDATRDNLYDNALPVLISEAVKSTMFVQPNLVGTAGWMTWAKVKEFKANLCDLQDHPAGIHTEMTTQQILDEYDGINAYFEANLLRRPYHTAYMGGKYSAASLLAVAEKRKSGRTVALNPMGANNGIFTIVSNNIGKSAGGDIMSVDFIKGLIRIAKETKRAAIFHCHGCDISEDNDWISPDNLTAIFQYAKSLGVDIITFSELYDLLDNATPVAEMSIVSNVAVLEITGGARITWDEYTDDCDGIELHRSIDGGTTWAKLADLASNVVSYDDTTLAAISIQYSLRAKKGTFDFSNFSSPVTINLTLSVLGSPVFWWDFQDATKVTTAGTGISAIQSKGANTLTLSQSTDDNRPSWTDSKCAEFNGTSDWLGVSLDGNTLAQPHTVLIDMIRSSTTAYFISFRGGGASFDILNNVLRIRSGNTFSSSNSIGAPSGIRRTFSFINNSSSSKIYFNGTLNAEGDSGTKDLGGNFRLGANEYNNNYLSGKIYQVMIFNRVLEAKEITFFKNYIASL